MKHICLYFQIHQPFRLKRYRFFDIGNDHYYYDDFRNEEIMRRITQKCYLPANLLLKEIIAKHPEFRVAFSISGTALEQLESYSPEALDTFRDLAETGCVEFLAETYAHSLSSLYDPEEFYNQTMIHSRRIEELFGVKPRVLRNTELIFSDDIATQVAEMGFQGMLTEGAKHILGWKSPNYLYKAGAAPELSLLLRNPRLSDAISAMFTRYDWNEYPLTADKMIRWIQETPEEEQIFNLFMNYEVLGSLHPQESGIFDFFRALPSLAEKSEQVKFATPSELIESYSPVAKFSSIYPISWVGEEKDTGTWLGNVLQQGARDKLEQWGERVRMIDDQRMLQDWLYLQSADHFYYMKTRGGDAGNFSPYETPYDAFNNYMNVLSDVVLRIQAQYPTSIENEELSALVLTIQNQDKQIVALEKELSELKAKKKTTKKSTKAAE